MCSLGGGSACQSSWKQHSAAPWAVQVIGLLLISLPGADRARRFQEPLGEEEGGPQQVQGRPCSSLSLADVSGPETASPR